MGRLIAIANETESNFMHNKCKLWTVGVAGFGYTLALMATPGVALGAISQSGIASPGGFIQAGAYSTSSGGSLIPGTDMVASIGAGQDFEEHAFAGLGIVSADAAYSDGVIINSTSGNGGMGFLRGSASNRFTCSNPFAIAGINGGWKETFTVSHPTLNGQAEFMVFQVRVHGTLAAHGFNGAAAVITTGYKNNTELMMNSLFNRGNSDAISTDRQRAQWGVASSPDITRNVDGAVTMAVPITFGQSFTLGVYAFIRAGQRSSGGGSCISTSSADFSSGGVTWGGIHSIQSGGTPVSGYTVVSATTFDWHRPYGVCISDVDDGTGSGNPDGGVTIDDLLYYLNIFDQGLIAADVDDGSGTGTPDGGVTIDDLLYFLDRFDAGC